MALTRAPVQVRQVSVDLGSRERLACPLPRAPRQGTRPPEGQRPDAGFLLPGKGAGQHPESGQLGSEVPWPCPMETRLSGNCPCPGSPPRKDRGAVALPMTPGLSAFGTTPVPPRSRGQWLHGPHSRPRPGTCTPAPAHVPASAVPRRPKPGQPAGELCGASALSDAVIELGRHRSRDGPHA